MTITDVVSALFVIAAPFSVGAAWFLWKLHALSRHLDDRSPKPLLRLSLIMAVTGTIGAAAAVLLGVGGLLYLSGDRTIVASLWPGILVGFVGLDLIPIINAGYLRWVDRTPPYAVTPTGDLSEPSAAAYDGPDQQR